MRIYREEIFGPILCAVRVANTIEAIERVNANPYADEAVILTNVGRAARHFERETEVGVVGSHSRIPVPRGACSFGGWKSSLLGGHSIYAREGVHFYSRVGSESPLHSARPTGHRARCNP